MLFILHCKNRVLQMFMYDNKGTLVKLILQRHYKRLLDRIIKLIICSVNISIEF